MADICLQIKVISSILKFHILITILTHKPFISPSLSFSYIVFIKTFYLLVYFKIESTFLIFKHANYFECIENKMLDRVCSFVCVCVLG